MVGGPLSVNDIGSVGFTDRAVQESPEGRELATYGVN